MERTVWVSGILLLGLLGQPAAAQSARSSTGNAQAMQQLQQLAAERTKLTADNAKLAADLAAVKKERDELKKKQDAFDQRSKGNEVAALRANSRADALQQELDRDKARLTELVGKFRETAVTLRDVETDRAAVKNVLGQRDADLAQCVKRNQSLYELNGEVLTKLESRGGGFSPLEPFTRLKRVELENLIDGYQTRAEEQRPPTAAAQSAH